MNISTKGTCLAVVALAATGGTAHATEARYECSAGSQLTVQFSLPGAADSQAVLTFAGSDAGIVLPQVMSADGGRYADDKIEFWIKGRNATLIRGDKRETCEVRSD
jgi:membrane-bound inhibitor of C-type lysozyme